MDMRIWNKAAILKLLWAIAFKQDKMWVRWINAYYMKRSNVMEVNLSNNTTKKFGYRGTSFG